MAGSVSIWKIYLCSKVSLYLERFLLKHATNHTQQRCMPLQKLNKNKNRLGLNK
jgi:hypothetical protein